MQYMRQLPGKQTNRLFFIQTKHNLDFGLR
jgi:hypothetical protein